MLTLIGFEILRKFAASVSHGLGTNIFLQSHSCKTALAYSDFIFGLPTFEFAQMLILSKKSSTYRRIAWQ